MYEQIQPNSYAIAMIHTNLGIADEAQQLNVLTRIIRKHWTFTNSLIQPPWTWQTRAFRLGR